MRLYTCAMCHRRNLHPALMRDLKTKVIVCLQCDAKRALMPPSRRFTTVRPRYDLLPSRKFRMLPS